MDSPLRRSPGSRVFKGVGLPITLPSSVLGGPQRLLEYWGTPPQSRSLLPFPPRQGVFQWPASLRTIPCELLVEPKRVWVVPVLDCQLEVGGSGWPCAKKRFTSSSPANSAKMVVFPKTHLETEGKTRGCLNLDRKSTSVIYTIKNRTEIIYPIQLFRLR